MHAAAGLDARACAQARGSWDAQADRPDQSDRPAYRWTVAEPGSWSELAESSAFVLRAGALSLHPLHLGVCLLGALAASWALPIRLEDLLPWLGTAEVGQRLWAWVRLAWVVEVACVCGVVVSRMIAARPSGAAVWRVLGGQLASGALCGTTLLSVLVGTVLVGWLGWGLGTWLPGSFTATVSAVLAFAALLAAGLAWVLWLLAIPAVSANDADTPDAIQRAAAHLIARPALTAALVVLSLAMVALAVLGSGWMLGWAYALVSEGWEQPPTLRWLPDTLGLLVALAVGWSAMTHTLLTLREVVDREDRSSCWDPLVQAWAIQATIEARGAVQPRAAEAAEAGDADEPAETASNEPDAPPKGQP